MAHTIIFVSDIRYYISFNLAISTDSHKPVRPKHSGAAKPKHSGAVRSLKLSEILSIFPSNCVDGHIWVNHLVFHQSPLHTVIHQGISRASLNHKNSGTQMLTRISSRVGILKKILSTSFVCTSGFSGVAHLLFDRSPERDQQLGESTVSEFAKDGYVHEALKSFHIINHNGIRPTKFTLCTVLNTCAKVLDLCLGLQIHARIVRYGYEENLFLNSALVDLYSKCDVMVDAKNVFYRMKVHDHVSWTSIISGFAQNGHGSEALILFKEMLETDIRPNSYTFSSVISACTRSGKGIQESALLHVHVIKLGFEPNTYVISSLIDCYSKCGEIDRAILLFNSALEMDIILVNSMIAGYSQNSFGEEAFRLFVEMRKEGLCPTDDTFASVLNACGSLTVLQQGRQIHSTITKTGSDRNVFVTSSMIDMYSKCGSIEEARRVFDQKVDKNSVLWTSMITGYAQSGRGEDGLELFEQFVKEEGVKPDLICFTALLTACNHAGLLDRGVEYFNKMRREYGLVPERDQYACLVDLYGKNGHLKKAKDLMEEMPFEPNAVMWTSFLGSCRVYGEVDLGREAANELFKMEPHSSAPYVALANIYADASMWREVGEIRQMMKEKGVRRNAGWSWIEI